VSWWTIVNPTAGRGTLATRVADALDGVGVSHVVNTSSSADDVAALVKEGVRAGYTHLVVVGGDGTVNLAVNAILSEAADVTLGVLPGGSGCDLVRTFGISQNIEEAARHLTGDETYTIDAGFVDGPWGRRYFANVASLGLGAAVVRIAERLPAGLGAFRYKLGVWPALARFRKTSLVMSAGSRRVEDVASLVVLANAQFFGGGMNVAPKASMIDGRLDVQVFTGPKRNAVVLQPRVTRGTHLTHKAVRRFSASTVMIELARSWEVEVDGEFVGSSSHIAAGVVPRALRIKI
jgi:YegS/Rv2252/BmrU family lipid kinase